MYPPESVYYHPHSSVSSLRSQSQSYRSGCTNIIANNSGVPLFQVEFRVVCPCDDFIV